MYQCNDTSEIAEHLYMLGNDAILFETMQFIRNDAIYSKRCNLNQNDAIIFGLHGFLHHFLTGNHTGRILAYDARLIQTMQCIPDDEILFRAMQFYSRMKADRQSG